MLYSKIDEIVTSYINGNISKTKAKVKRMSKIDFLNFILILDIHNQDIEKTMNQAKRLVLSNPIT